MCASKGSPRSVLARAAAPCGPIQFMLRSNTRSPCTCALSSATPRPVAPLAPIPIYTYNIYLYIYIHLYMCVCVYIYYAYMYIHTYTHITNTHTHTHMYVCMYIYIYYIHTHTYLYIHRYVAGGGSWEVLVWRRPWRPRGWWAPHLSASWSLRAVNRLLVIILYKLLVHAPLIVRPVDSRRRGINISHYTMIMIG